MRAPLCDKRTWPPVNPLVLRPAIWTPAHVAQVIGANFPHMPTEMEPWESIVSRLDETPLTHFKLPVKA